MNQAFEDWKEDARLVPLLQAASMAGAKLKRAGNEHVGPCPVCGGKDRFSVNPAKGVWNCRGAQGGHDPISLIMHAMSFDFKAACELLTGTPPPTGQRGQIDPQAAQRAAERRKQAELEQRRREDEQALSDARRKAYSKQIWQEAVPIAGTPVELYPKGFYVNHSHLIPSIRAHASLRHPSTKQHYPGLVCCVVDQNKKFLCIWRIFLDHLGSKAAVPEAKMALGKPEGGAVWVGTPDQFNSPIWGVAEGFENALCAWAYYKREMPFFATLSTSGMQNFILPDFVNRAVIFPDGDLPHRLPNGEWGKRAGSWAAQKLSMRLKEEGRKNHIEQPPQDGDWKDMWVNAVERGLVNEDA